MKEKYNIKYDNYNININFDEDYMKEMLSYHVELSDEEKLDKIDINVIEKYLRKKKLKSLNNS